MYPHHCAPSDYTAMIVQLQRIEAGEVSPRDIDWRTQSGVLWRMLHYATRPTDASVDSFLEREALVTELIALQSKWRLRHESEQDYYYNGLWEACADELAGVIKVTK